MATVASHKRLFTHYQCDGVDNHTYHREFLAHVETIETYGGVGAIGVVPAFLSMKIKEMADAGTIKDANAPTDNEKRDAIQAVRDEYLAALMLSGSNREKFSDLRNDLKNQYGYGEDRYPKTIDQTLSLLNRWLPSSTTRTSRTNATAQVNAGAGATPNQGNEALVFVQDGKPKPTSPNKTSNDDTSSKSSSSSNSKRITNLRCKACGQLGHMSAVCPNKKPPDQIHAMTEIDDASIASDEESTVILAQQDDHKPVNPNYVLIDSQSTVHLFSNPSHVQNIRQAEKPINVHCNKGTVSSNTVGDFSDNEVYLHTSGIANVLSLHKLGKKYHITYDSQDRGGVFKVHTPKGVVEFIPTSKGLHYVDLSTTPEAAYMLVNASSDDEEEQEHEDHNLHVTTVRDNFEGFTKKQVQQAHRARRLMSMLQALLNKISKVWYVLTCYLNALSLMKT